MHTCNNIHMMIFKKIITGFLALFYIASLYTVIKVLGFPMYCDDGSCIIQIYSVLFIPIILFLLWKPASRKTLKHILYTLGFGLLYGGLFIGFSVLSIKMHIFQKQNTSTRAIVTCPTGTYSFQTNTCN